LCVFHFIEEKKIKANWNDHKTTILLKLMLEQVEAGNYSQGNMNTTAYNTILENFWPVLEGCMIGAS